ncbi:hypothetical protein ACFPU1_10285 [Thalassorhabdus alkalitolerans]|uniref:Uncharacterized protein n=1 Tax=Thalassorhabdus alkalitolerans TaxID=2282697 RepID=A0ABW0YRJ1_9BACI
MLITMEDELIYIYFQGKASKDLPIGTYPDVNGYLLYSDDNKWLGYRLMRTVRDHESITLPKIKKIDYPLFSGSVEDADRYVELKFDKDTPIKEMHEQECLVDFNEYGIFGIEIIRKPENPQGKDELVKYFIEP